MSPCRETTTVYQTSIMSEMYAQHQDSAYISNCCGREKRKQPKPSYYELIFPCIVLNESNLPHWGKYYPEILFIRINLGFQLTLLTRVHTDSAVNNCIEGI